jgi:hypothetical protein
VHVLARRTGSPTAIGLIATLWPEGMRSTVVTPSATDVPGGRLARAISTPSSGCRRMTGLMVMAGLLGSSRYRAPDAAQRESGALLIRGPVSRDV